MFKPIKVLVELSNRAVLLNEENTVSGLCFFYSIVFVTEVFNCVFFLSYSVPKETLNRALQNHMNTFGRQYLQRGQ